MTDSRDEWQRSHPDFVVFLPDPKKPEDAENQHFNVVVTPRGSFLAFWTQSSWESQPDQRVVVSRSDDDGRTWSPHQTIDGPTPDDPPGVGLASWEFPVVTSYGRVWCFYTKNIGVQDVRTADTGVLRGRYSDDDGLTWSRTYDYPIGPSAISHPDPKVPPTWIVYQTPLITPEKAVLAGFTRWASNAVDGEKNMLELTSEIWFLRFENILTEPDPARLVVTTWPNGPDPARLHGIRVPHPHRPGISVAQEPTTQPLSDGRMICVFRTMTGRIWFSLSHDDGRSWNEPQPLRYEPGGEEMLNPIAPCPLYRLSDGRFFLVFYNNDGSGNGGNGPGDYKKNRTPAWFSVGEEIPDHPTHPIAFGPPHVLVSNEMIPAGPVGRTEIATYPSFFEHDGRRYFWYPDRKHFLLGKLITDAMLAER